MNKKILIIDDDIDICQMLQRLLVTSGRRSVLHHQAISECGDLWNAKG